MKRDEFIKTLTSWDGAVRGDAAHKRIVDAYNSFLPHPRGYKLDVDNSFGPATQKAWGEYITAYIQQIIKE